MLRRAWAIQNERNAAGNLARLETTDINLYKDPATGVPVIVDIQECLNKIASTATGDLASAKLLAQMAANKELRAALIAAQVSDPTSVVGYRSAPKFLERSLGLDGLRPYLALALMHIVGDPNYKEMQRQDEAELKYIQEQERAGHPLTLAQLEFLEVRVEAVEPVLPVTELYSSSQFEGPRLRRIPAVALRSPPPLPVIRTHLPGTDITERMGEPEAAIREYAVAQPEAQVHALAAQYPLLEGARAEIMAHEEPVGDSAIRAQAHPISEPKYRFRIEGKKFFTEVLQLTGEPGFFDSAMQALEEFISTVDSHWIESEGAEQLATFRLEFNDPGVHKACAQLLAKIAHSADDGLFLLHRCLCRNFIVGLLAVIEAGSLEARFRAIAQEATEILAQILFNQAPRSDGLRIGPAILWGDLQLPREPLAPLGSSDYPDFIKRQILQGLESIYAAGLYTKSTDKLVEHVKILLLLWATGENENVQIRAGVLASSLIKSATEPFKSDMHALVHSIMITLQQHEVPLGANVRVAGINLLRDIANNQGGGAEALALSILREGGFRVFGDAPPLPGQSIREAMEAENGVLTVVEYLKTRPFDKDLARVLSDISKKNLGSIAILAHLDLLLDSLNKDQGENRHLLIEILQNDSLVPLYCSNTASILKKLNTKALLALLEILHYSDINPLLSHADSWAGEETTRELYERLSLPGERQNFLAAGGVVQLLKLAGPAQSQARIAQKAQAALSIIAQDPDACAQIREAGGVEMLARLFLGTDDRSSHISIAKELTEQMWDLDKCRKILATPLVMTRFLIMFMRGQSSGDPRIAIAALGVLGNIAMHDEGLAALEREPGSITTITLYLPSARIAPEAEAAAAVAGALSNIVRSKSAAQQVINANGVNELLALTYRSDPPGVELELQLQVMWALGNISKHKEGYKAIRDAGGLARILPCCLSRETPDEIRYHALRALVHMLQSKKDCKELNINALQSLLPSFAEAKKDVAKKIKNLIEIALDRASVFLSPIPPLAAVFRKMSPRDSGPGPGPTPG